LAATEARVPEHLLSDIEMIIVGWFDEFVERSINAFYQDGTIFISNLHHDEEDIYDDIIHETAHSVEEAHGYFLYADEKLKDEFLRKRKHLHDILWSLGFKAPESFFMDIEFNEEFDKFLHEKIGYDKLSAIMQGMFITPYAATSLREYFATGFADFYTDSDHKFLEKVSPQLYKKIVGLQNPDTLDNRA
tara:strand:+ start:271 stop:840 length:570 start_codon:yes stop_codon:yes gene_type:complete